MPGGIIYIYEIWGMAALWRLGLALVAALRFPSIKVFIIALPEITEAAP